jgi:hypothetical protein
MNKITSEVEDRLRDELAKQKVIREAYEAFLQEP